MGDGECESEAGFGKNEIVRRPSRKVANDGLEWNEEDKQSMSGRIDRGVMRADGWVGVDDGGKVERKGACGLLDATRLQREL